MLPLGAEGIGREWQLVLRAIEARSRRTALCVQLAGLLSPMVTDESDGSRS